VDFTVELGPLAALMQTLDAPRSLVTLHGPIQPAQSKNECEGKRDLCKEVQTTIGPRMAQGDQRSQGAQVTHNSQYTTIEQRARSSKESQGAKDTFAAVPRHPVQIPSPYIVRVSDTQAVAK